MISSYLQSANGVLEDLIQATKLDLSDVQNARHEEIFKRTKLKEELVRSFEDKKLILDNEISSLLSANADKNITELLDDEQKDLLAKMKENLVVLQDHNKTLAALVISVTEFYDSLLSTIIPKEESGYGKNPQRRSSFLNISG